MAWLQSFQEIARHPKTRRAARTLDISLPTVIGHLHLLWWWCLDFAADGDLTPFSDVDIADAALWEGDANLFVEALVQAGFIDAASSENESQSGQRPEGKTTHRSVHDWDDYGGKLLTQRNANAEKVRAWREKNEAPKRPRGRPKTQADTAAIPADSEANQAGEKISNGYVPVTKPSCNPIRVREREELELPPCGGGEGAREATPPPRAVTTSPLQPAPDDDVAVALIAICGVNVRAPSARDVAHWPAALEVARRLSATPEQLHAFRDDWLSTPTASGQPKRNLYLSNVAAHLPQFLQTKPEVRPNAQQLQRPTTRERRHAARLEVRQRYADRFGD